MKDEIKEILEYLKNYDYSQVFADEGCDDTPYKLFDENEAKTLLDYITNLEKIEREYSAILSENAELENKITNLQEENKRLECRLEDEYKNYKRAIEYLHEENKELKADYGTKAQIERDTYKTRNEKAINCINHYATENDDYSKLYSIEEEELLEILQGKSDE